MKRILLLVLLSFVWIGAKASSLSDTTTTNGVANAPNCFVTSSLPSGNYHTCITSQAPSLASITLTASGAGSNYTWSPATGLSATTGASVVANPTVTTTYTLNGTGCTTPVQVTVTVFKPQGTLTASNLNPCQGTPVDFTLVGANVNQYSWNITPSTLNNGTDNPFGTGATLATTNTRTLQTAGGSNGINPGSYDIQVLASDVRYDNDPNALSCYFNSTPLTVTIHKPTVNISKLSDGNVCVGDVVTLTATGASTYVWSPAAGLSATTGTSVTFTATAAMVGMIPPYTAVGTDAFGCVSQSSSTADIGISPIPMITVTPSSATICPGGAPVTLTASGGVASPFSPEDPYTWTPTTGLSATTGAVVSASPTTTTTYTVTGKDVRSGCKGTATAKITVVNPVVTITPSTTQPVCKGQSVTINSVLTGGTAADYTWFISPNTLSSGVTNPQDQTKTQNLVFNTANLAPGTYTIGQSILTNGNCIGNSNEIQIVVKATPEVRINGNAKVYCVGDVVTMTASGADSYAWSPAAGLSAITGSSVTFTLGSTTPPAYQVIGTTAGCSETKTLASLGLVYNPRPTVTTSGNQTICGRNTTVISAMGARSYTWSPTTGLTINATGSGVAAYVERTTTYTVTGTDANGCKNTANVTITVDPSIGAPNQSVTYNCETKVLTIIPAEDPKAFNYTINDVKYETNIIGPTFGVLPANNPIEIVVRNTTTGCYNISKFTLPACALPVSWLNTTATLNSNKTISVNWETADEVDNKGFEVERSSNAKSFERINTTPPLGAGGLYQFIDLEPLLGVSYYRVKQLDNDGGFSYSRIVSVINDTGIESFPNPTADQLTITMPQGLTGSAQLTDINGRSVKQLPLLQIQQTLKLDNTATGTYFLTIYDDKNQVLKTQKIVKQ